MLTRSRAAAGVLGERLSTVRGSLPVLFLQKFMNDRALTLASLLAWGILNTFLPLLLGILALLGMVLGDSPEVAAIEQRLLALLPAEMSTIVSASLDAFDEAAGGVGLLSLGLLLFNGSNFFVTLETTFDVAYHVPERNLVLQRVVSFAALFVVASLVLLTSVAAAIGGVFGESVAQAMPRIGPAFDFGQGTLVSLFSLLATMYLMYWLLPNTRISPMRALPGAIAATLAFLLVLRIFPLYVALFGAGFSVYAAFGTVLLFMFWLYIVGVILIAGAVINAFLEDPMRSAELSSIAAQAMVGRLDLPSRTLD